MNIALPVLLFALVSTTAIAKKMCDKESLKKCLFTLERLVFNQFDGTNKTQKDQSLYCRTLEIAGECLRREPGDCEKEYPNILKLISSFHTHINQLCNDQGQLYMEIALCVENYKLEFGNCWSHERTQRNEESDDICMETESMQCVADLGKKKCRNGESFGNDLEQYVKRLESDICSSATVLAKYFEILCATVFSLLFIRITF